MQKSIITTLSLIVVMLFPSTPGAAGAISDDDLYRAQTIVTGTGEAERVRGFRVAFSDVLTKLVGHNLSANITHDSLKTINPADFVAAYDYEDRMKGIPLHDEQGTRDRPHFLRIQFDKAKVNALLTTLNLAKWPVPRPTITVVLGIHTKAGNYILGAEGGAGYGQRAVLVDHAALRGIPLRLPSAETIDKASVSFNDVAAFNLDQLHTLATKDQPLLIGTLELRDEGYWDINWLFIHRDERLLWSMQKVTFDTALKDGIERSALTLSKFQETKKR